MKTIPRFLAVLELMLVFPAVLFMTSLFARNLQPAQYEPARSAQRIVDWYASSPHVGLWVLLIALPLTVLATGTAALVREWGQNEELRSTTRQTLEVIRLHVSELLVAGATVAAGGILAIVGLHLLTE